MAGDEEEDVLVLGREVAREGEAGGGFCRA